MLSGALIVLVGVVTVKALALARGRASYAEARSKFRVLSEDVGRGELHAVRVRAGEPVRMRYLKRGDKASVAVFALRGTGESTRALPDGPYWTVCEESDPSIA